MKTKKNGEWRAHVFSHPFQPFPQHQPRTMFALSTRTALPTRRAGVVAKASTGNWAPGTEKPKYLEGAPG